MPLNTDDCYIPGPIEENSKVSTIFLSGLSYLLGSLSNDDGHGNENVERAITLLRNTTVTSHAKTYTNGFPLNG